MGSDPGAVAISGRHMALAKESSHGAVCWPGRITEGDEPLRGGSNGYDPLARQVCRWTFHFTPTSASWLNAVEGFFARLSNRRLRRGVFHSLVDVQAAINRYLAEHNQSPKPFVWTADPDAIIAAASRGYQVLDSIH
jgi:hypothetical protein